MKGYYYIDRLVSIIILDKSLSDKSKLLFGIISSFSKNANGYCFLNYLQLAEMLGISKRRLYVCIQQLESSKYIKKVKLKTRTYLKPSRDLELEVLGERKNREINRDSFYYDWINDDSES